MNIQLTWDEVERVCNSWAAFLFCSQFVPEIDRGGDVVRVSDVRIVAQAIGECLYASQWGHGQMTVETDVPTAIDMQPRSLRLKYSIRSTQMLKAHTICL